MACTGSHQKPGEDPSSETGPTVPRPESTAQQVTIPRHSHRFAGNRHYAILRLRGLGPNHGALQQEVAYLMECDDVGPPAALGTNSYNKGKF